MSYTIITKSYGNYSACAGTVQNAMIIFENFVENIPTEISEIAKKDKSKFFLSSSWLAKILGEVLSKKTTQLRNLTYGYAKKDVADTRPEITFEESWVNELKLFLFDKGIAMDKLKTALTSPETASNLLESMSFFNPLQKKIGEAKVCLIDYDEYFDAAASFNTIVNSNWKSGAPEHKKIAYILEFVQTWLVDKSDTSFECVELTPEWT